MDTAVVALIISGASLIVSAVSARYTIDAIKQKREDERLADEANWNFRIINDDKRIERYINGSVRRRQAVISYLGQRDVEIVLLTPLVRFDEAIIPAVDFPDDDDNPSGRIPGFKTGSGSLLSVDIVIRDIVTDNRRCREFWFYVDAATRPKGTRNHFFEVDVIATFEELVASRRVRQIRLKSDKTAWASEDTANAT